MDELIKKIIKFRDDRDWKQYHTPANLAKSISIEAGELLENFQWDDRYEHDKVLDELADVMMYCILMADRLDVDIEDMINKKLIKNEEKYPIHKAKGKSDKYTKL
jgi:NTP pyrophosphatase (non-canonical NTP hydrolase)